MVSKTNDDSFYNWPLMTSSDLNIALRKKITLKALIELSNAFFRVFLSFLVFELRRVVILTPPPTMAKLAETPTRARASQTRLFR